MQKKSKSYQFRLGNDLVAAVVLGGAALLGSSVLAGTVEGERRISVAEYRDKMAAGWIGQIAGVGIGGPTEFKTCYYTVAPEKVRSWSPNIINEAFRQDDLYVEMTFLRTLETKGLGVSSREAGIDFANSRYGLWHANAEGRNNLRRGIAPPDSGHPANNPCANCIDYQIEADYSGLVSPGLPQGAIELGEKFGRLMNYGDGLYAGQFIGAMYAAAFFETDPVKIVEEALKAIPAESRYAEMVRDCLKWHAERPQDWEYGFYKIVPEYGFEKGRNHVTCPVQPNVIEAPLNGAMVLLGVLWGNGDLDKTMRYACYGGFDSDCNPSSAGGVIFTSKGMKNLPKAYYEKLDHVQKFDHTDYNFDQLVDVCEKIARQVVVKNGGRIVKEADGEWFVFPVKAPVPSALESYAKPGPLVGAKYTDAELLRIHYPASNEKRDAWKRWREASSARPGSRVLGAGGLEWRVGSAGCADAAATKSVQAALDRVFPGWSTSDNAEDMKPGLRQPPNANGANCLSVMTHPLRDGNVTLSRELTLPSGSPALKVRASAQPGGDWEFIARVNGEVVAKRLVDQNNPLEIEVPLAKWSGQKVKVELVNATNGWSYENAYWHRIEIANARGQ